MPLTLEEKQRIDQSATKLLNKLLVTGRAAFQLTIQSLRQTVLGGTSAVSKPVPIAIQIRVQKIKTLLDSAKNQFPTSIQTQNEFKNRVKRLVRQKIYFYRTLTTAQKKAYVIEQRKPLSFVEKNQYATLVQETLDKIRITSKRAFSLIINALKKEVLKAPITTNKKIPSELLASAQRVKELITDIEDLWIPLNPAKADNPAYVFKTRLKQKEFSNLVKYKTQEWINQVENLSRKEKSALVKQHRTLVETQKNRATANHLKPRQSSVESEGYVEERAQWRINLMFPMEGDGLSEHEMCLLASIIDLEKYPWGYAQLLTADIPLAQWLSSESINNLLMADKLNFSEHGALLTEPSQEEKDSLQTLAPFILSNQLSVRKALDTYISEEAKQTLLAPEFIARATSSTLNDNDFALLISMNLSLNNEDEREDEPDEFSDNISNNYSDESDEYEESEKSEERDSDIDDYSAFFSYPKAKPRR
ncbi:hypothetical protein CC99x_003115 [Candidatus Berkiella cookevillensis]|uniref:Uncharacterized protein n=1 Tax=Candidatus Berkiella cookevillensis TaxID=437022 RepID=A0A0Q9YDE2_9GAMM|nr:hypothetical protein [Candidatus Berkiella cookevillensis]MCS5707888.1 hypothetical protein [Candidatus Berkiella cookevillensis]